METVRGCDRSVPQFPSHDGKDKMDFVEAASAPRQIREFLPETLSETSKHRGIIRTVSKFLETVSPPVDRSASRSPVSDCESHRAALLSRDASHRKWECPSRFESSVVSGELAILAGSNKILGSVANSRVNLQTRDSSRRCRGLSAPNLIDPRTDAGQVLAKRGLLLFEIDVG